MGFVISTFVHSFYWIIQNGANPERQWQPVLAKLL